MNCASRACAARGWSLLDEVLLVCYGFQSQPVIITRRVECEIASSMQPKIQFDIILCTLFEGNTLPTMCLLTC